MSYMTLRSRLTTKEAALLAHLRLVHGASSIYELARSVRRPYRRVYQQVRKLAVLGLVTLEKGLVDNRTAFRVRPVAQGKTRVANATQPSLSHNRAWSRPTSGVDDDTLIALVISNPNFPDLLACAKHFGIERIRAVYRKMLDGFHLRPSVAEEAGRMLENIEIGFRRAA
jgi:hypothetical protein